jgi:hypothetical protein
VQSASARDFYKVGIRSRRDLEMPATERVTNRKGKFCFQSVWRKVRLAGEGSSGRAKSEENYLDLWGENLLFCSTNDINWEKEIGTSPRFLMTHHSQSGSTEYIMKLKMEISPGQRTLLGKSRTIINSFTRNTNAQDERMRETVFEAIGRRA